MKVYLDNAATTPLAPEVIDEMTKVLREHFGNPSSVHAFGRDAKNVVELARRRIATLINAEPKEIIFTSGGTEADNTAILCAVQNLGVTRIISSEIEHHAVLHCLDHHPNVQIDFVKLSPSGEVDLIHLEELLQDSAKTLVTLMHANNEIGTLIDLKRVSEICVRNGAYFHSDTVQTMGHYLMDVREINADFLTCSAHKFHGPKGIGFLYVKKGLKLSPLMHGGAQERGMRGGTENIAGIVGLAKAFELANHEIEVHKAYVQGLKSFMVDELKRRIPRVNFHGEIEPEKSLYTVLNVCFPSFENKSMLLFLLDLEGVATSGGSACTAGAATGSHVLRGIGADLDRPNARFSFSRFTTKEEIIYALDCIEKIVVLDAVKQH